MHKPTHEQQCLALAELALNMRLIETADDVEWVLGLLVKAGDCKPFDPFQMGSADRASSSSN